MVTVAKGAKAVRLMFMVQLCASQHTFTLERAPNKCGSLRVKVVHHQLSGSCPSILPSVRCSAIRGLLARAW